MNRLVDQTNRMVTKLLKPLDNKLIGTTTRVALILYASLIAPELPDVVARQFDNIVVRSVLIFLIAYLAIKDPLTAALATLALMVTVMSLHRRDVQSVLGKTASLVKRPVDMTDSVKQDMTESVTQDMTDSVPSGVEGDMDDAGML